MGNCFLLVEESHWVLRGVRVGSVLPVWISYGVRLVDQVLIIATCHRIHIARAIDRLRGGHGNSGTNSATGISIAVFLIHELCRHVEVQVLVEERRCQVDRSVQTVHPRGLHDTVGVVEANTCTIRHVLQATLHAYAMVGRHCRAEDLILPVGVSVAKLRGIEALDGINQVLVLCGVQHLVLLLDSGNGHVAIVSHRRLLAIASLLRGNDDDTIGGAATIDGSCGSILQDRERLDIAWVDHGKDVTHTSSSLVVDDKTVDNIQRVVRRIQGSATTDTNLSASTRSTTCGLHVHAGDFTHQHVRCVVSNTL